MEIMFVLVHTNRVGCMSIWADIHTIHECNRCMAQLLSLTGHGQPGPGKEARSWQWRSQVIGIGRAPALC